MARSPDTLCIFMNHSQYLINDLHSALFFAKGFRNNLRFFREFVCIFFQQINYHGLLDLYFPGKLLPVATQYPVRANFSSHLHGHLGCKVRIKLCRDVSLSLYERMRANNRADPFAKFPELDGYDIHAGDRCSASATHRQVKNTFE